MATASPPEIVTVSPRAASSDTPESAAIVRLLLASLSLATLLRPKIIVPAPVTGLPESTSMPSVP